MARPTYIWIDQTALVHNVNHVKTCAPGKKIIAMVKANAYGCGLASVVPVLDGRVDAYGVACLEEAMQLRTIGSRTDCILFQGVFSADEFQLVAEQEFQCVIHQQQQLRWLLSKPLSKKIKIWIKVDTGMHRLGFDPADVAEVMSAALDCSWIDDDIGIITHLACADTPEDSFNQQQLQKFEALDFIPTKYKRSIANSAAILALPQSHADIVRPGIMLYGVSPFAQSTGTSLGLMPVMHFMSVISAIHHFPPHARVGYGGRWQSEHSSVIGIVAVGYGDGYPRHVVPGTPVWVNGTLAPIVGSISMDMMTVDLTHCAGVKEGDRVELWGKHVPVENIAKSAGTIPYELICQISPRVRL